MKSIVIQWIRARWPPVDIRWVIGACNFRVWLQFHIRKAWWKRPSSSRNICSTNGSTDVKIIQGTLGTDKYPGKFTEVHTQQKHCTGQVHLSKRHLCICRESLKGDYLSNNPRGELMSTPGENPNFMYPQWILCLCDKCVYACTLSTDQSGHVSDQSDHIPLTFVG